MKAQRLCSVGLVALVCSVGVVPSLHAQWASQAITLQPGWNAVYLEVQPEPREADAVLAGLPVESVWRWNRRFNPVEFIVDPTTLVLAQPDWLVYLPPHHPLTTETSLYTIDGGRPYLIKLAAGSGPMTWTVTGKVVLRPVEWLSDSLNFVGFTLPTSQTPTFQAFFQNSSAHTSQPIHRLSVEGYWQQVPANALMRHGEAFWIRCRGRSSFQGPLDVDLAQRTGLDYGRSLVEQGLTIKNTSSTSKTVRLRRLDSASAPPGSAEPLAGQVPLNYWKFDPAGGDAGWTPLPATLTKTLAPGEEWALRLEVRRNEMSAPTMANAVYQSVIEVTDAANSSRTLVPVTAQGMRSAPGGGPHPRAGLWVGSAEITHVNEPSSMNNPTVPMPTAAPFQFRLLVHVDAAGTARLLQKVLQMWKPGTYRLNQDGIQELDEPGRFVLVTDDSLIPNYTGAALRDGQPVARRFSSAAFAFREAIGMDRTGQFGEPNSLVRCDVILDYNDPLNPFVHRYHPDHNNLDERQQPLPERTDPSGLTSTVESWSIQRTLSLQFTDSDPDNLALAGWGDTQLGGIYQETVTGLHKAPLFIRGTFRLHQASRVAALNQ